MKKLIVNADDWGMSAKFNEGILRAIIEGTCTSTTVLVDRPFVRESLETLLECDVSVGLHFDLPEEKNAQVAEELHRQLAAFEKVFNRKPTHLDSHYNVHLKAELLPAVIEFAKSESLPVRMRYNFDRDSLRAAGIRTTDYFLNPMRKNAFEMNEMIKSAPEGTGELMMHPGLYDPESKSSMNREREEQMNFLLSEEFKKTIYENGFTLIDWREL